MYMASDLNLKSSQLETTYILHLETSTRVCSVAVSKNGELHALEEVMEDGYAHGEKLTTLIEACIQKAGISLQDLGAVSVASGPGSYTGLRIGVSTAKGFCYALNIPLLSVDSLTSLIEIAREKHNDKNLCALIDARRMEVYSKIVSSENEVLKEISADVIERNTYSEFNPFVYFGDGAMKLQETWNNEDVIFDNLLSSAKGQCQVTYNKFKNEDFEDVAYFEPYYLKDFIAIKSKKNLL